ncbi:MAG: hypothetical protein ACD_17C00276G0003 [uncultured bacterium]|nr:MAG: hypothetical protein ACD_17C00276G0003 [uncultured bacterium]OGN56670.1 MAG: hypothetical protein A2796_03835 [Chlamydiae bacterium RIFCSPHIGHO2_01_FULL_44_39]OGN57186.1 MAG: hypothetical protein A3C42_02060 [Chlamydiae bacterium RIFCSPHIGHO2_02_FULL_45_9]OGN61178.1 MAG: hypothetical protein A3D96_06010 [Chlamydiae bacterium RIFCSPHIGHO2_12_FULL_44_59]OGN65648.1 MAG: hypothetical protein A2978_06815 [Chlamydiae bacterium RIFCSPLOWO2_01_FULL_44_52]OGN68125.1 MAG: hypothetical protein A3
MLFSLYPFYCSLLLANSKIAVHLERARHLQNKVTTAANLQTAKNLANAQALAPVSNTKYHK